ncbi:MAG: methyltransferase domain-containing protein [Thermoguttaceae bacterium]|nr:methyltransferase domain-containing protein [Thermoguttaceae bacterium]
MPSFPPLMPPQYLEPSPSPIVARDKKEPAFYRGLQIGADTHLHDQLMGLIRKIFPSGEAGRAPLALDLGCGEGALAQRLFDEGFQVVAVDKEVGVFRGNGPSFLHVDFDQPTSAQAALAPWNGKADLVVAVEVIEHLRRPYDFLVLCHFLCRPGGHLIITTPNVASWWSRLWFLLTGELWGFQPESLADLGHIHAWSCLELGFVLSEVGFEVRGWYLGGCLPVIWTYNWKRLLASVLMLPLRPLMRGPKDGWVVCFHAQKPLAGGASSPA